MGQVSDKLSDMGTKQNLTLGLLFIIAVGLVGAGAFNSMMPGADDGEQPNDISDLDKVDYNKFTTDFEVADSALTSNDTVYIVSADAELPDNYNDRTVAASDIESDFGSDVEVYSNSHNGVSVNDGEIVISSNAIGENEDFDAGQEYRVFTDATSDYTSFDSFKISEEIRWIDYDKGLAETDTVGFYENPTYSVDETATSSDGDDHTKRQTTEVEDGTALMGAVDVSNVGDNVTEVTVTVTADGEQVYSETSDGSADDETIASALSADLVEEDMEFNPVTAEDSVEVSVEVEADGSTNSVDVALNELDGTSVASFTTP